jgi:hypothetical protein
LRTEDKKIFEVRLLLEETIERERKISVINESVERMGELRTVTTSNCNNGAIRL